MNTEVPRLVCDDPWLEPHAEGVVRRLKRFEETLAAIERESGSLVNHANGHKIVGIHHHAATDCWTVREWAPSARAVSLIGDFNGWDRGKTPLSPVGQGTWQVQLEGSVLAHGQLVKLHIIGADGSHRDRIPAFIRRAVQDPSTRDFTGQIWSPAQSYAWRHPFDPAAVTAPLNTTVPEASMTPSDPHARP